MLFILICIGSKRSKFQADKFKFACCLRVFVLACVHSFLCTALTIDVQLPECVLIDAVKIKRRIKFILKLARLTFVA